MCITISSISYKVQEPPHLSSLPMFVIKQDPRFKDAEDEDEYQAGRKNPILRDIKTCRLKGQQEVESSDSVKFEPPLYIQRYAAVSQILFS